MFGSSRTLQTWAVGTIGAGALLFVVGLIVFGLFLARFSQAPEPDILRISHGAATIGAIVAFLGAILFAAARQSSLARSK